MGLKIEGARRILVFLHTMDCARNGIHLYAIRTLMQMSLWSQLWLKALSYFYSEDNQGRWKLPLETRNVRLFIHVRQCTFEWFKSLRNISCGFPTAGWWGWGGGSRYHSRDHITFWLFPRTSLMWLFLLLYYYPSGKSWTMHHQHVCTSSQDTKVQDTNIVTPPPYLSFNSSSLYHFCFFFKWLKNWKKKSKLS